MAKYLLVLCGVVLGLAILASCEEKKELLVVAVATEATDGYERFMRSARVYGYNVKVLGMGEQWLGGDMAVSPGGGQKVNLFMKELQRHRNDTNLIIMFTDSYDVILTAPPSEVLQKFDKLRGRIVFAAEDFCWPDGALASSYPKVAYGYRYLNSGGIIGSAADLSALFASTSELAPDADDQLFYTQLFLDKRVRTESGLVLDTHAQIFQNLHGNSADVALKFKDDDTRLSNTVYQTKPVVIHGNGQSKTVLAALGNYLAKSWTFASGCLRCSEHMNTTLATIPDGQLPVVVVAVFVEHGTPFLEEMLAKVALLDYPKNRLHLRVHSQAVQHEALLLDWLTTMRATDLRSVTFVGPKDKVKEWHARNGAVTHCLELDCDALFSVDSEVHLDNPQTLRLLLQVNRPIVAAIIHQVGKSWSTFWGAVTGDGYYARSSDYMQIVNGDRRGVWVVPYITGCYLVQRRLLEDERTRPSFIHNLLDADMAFTMNYRDKDILMYASNLDNYGHLVDSSNFPEDKLFPDMWQMAINQQDWEQRYLHSGYYKALEPKTLNEMPCPDVYWFPVFTERYCSDLIAMAEDHGGWSGGKNKDERISGGYENVPTVDIHMTQLEYQQEALWILKEYIKPLSEKVFLGYTGDARADLIFLVRYRPTEQSFLRPHHDSSTYTINVGFNKPQVDYEGGGAHFIRYNCSVINTKVGWALMHPGRLTHYHEGLQTTKGTRYIMIAFIDP